MSKRPLKVGGTLLKVFLRNFEMLGHNCENYTFFIYVRQQVRVLNRAGTGASRLNSLDLELRLSARTD